MGGREHSVVVDSESWTMTTEKKNKSDSHLCGHMTEDTVKGRQQEGCGVQVWDRVMLSWAHGGTTFWVTPRIILKSIPDPSYIVHFLKVKSAFLNRIIAASPIKKHYNKNKIYFFLTSTPPD